MNSLLTLWNVLTGLAQSLARTKELVDTANARMEQSLGLDAPPLKALELDSTPRRKGKE